MTNKDKSNNQIKPDQTLGSTFSDETLTSRSRKQLPVLILARDVALPVVPDYCAHARQLFRPAKSNLIPQIIQIY